MTDSDPERRMRVGLCASCLHARAICSERGSEFWLCKKSKVDPRFAKYPPLPMRACPGFMRADPTAR